LIKDITNVQAFTKDLYSIMESIIKHEMNGKNIQGSDFFFPSWFLSTFRENNKNAESMEFPYYYENWIEGINYRQWSWWSCGVFNNSLQINLETYDLVYMIDPLVYIFTTLNIKLKQVFFSEMGEPFRKLNIS
ncbi:MAG: hypothetical protein ACHQII_04930, partial [Bacteroidia bacterium]